MKPTSMASIAPPMLLMANGMQNGFILRWPAACSQRKQQCKCLCSKLTVGSAWQLPSLFTVDAVVHCFMHP
jgi:hypothetical protein